MAAAAEAAADCRRRKGGALKIADSTFSPLPRRAAGAGRAGPRTTGRRGDFSLQTPDGLPCHGDPERPQAGRT